MGLVVVFILDCFGDFGLFTVFRGLCKCLFVVDLG